MRRPQRSHSPVTSSGSSPSTAPVRSRREIVPPSVTSATSSKRTLPARSGLSIEPGGQLELSTAPAVTASAALESLRIDERWLRGRSARAGIALDPMAFDAQRRPEVILRNGRYVAMEQFWSATDGVGGWMMANTASTQINIGHLERDPLLRWRTASAIGPLLVAMFASSGGTDVAGQRWESLREGVWRSMHPARTAPVDATGSGPRAWLEYAMNADVFFVRTAEDGSGVAVPPGLTFGAWLRRGSELGWPTIEDLQYHLSTLFPPVRPKGWLELRMIDSLDDGWRTAAVLAVATALHPQVAGQLLESLPRTEHLWLAAARSGLRDGEVRRAVSVLLQVIIPRLELTDSSAMDLDVARSVLSERSALGWSPSCSQFSIAPVRLDPWPRPQPVRGRVIGIRRRGVLAPLPAAG